uniref:Uncharacterized protein n=1 Tax=Candidatus Kentrum sp. SD TaxID=2126332 RepID=A0A450YCD5_9GAMM|nr:MAG: hypothetical protein BECKSD772F_GA0070984_100212 [Candidatus Kentron sp. SD]VFK39123.1 MAG: hypothetical protein BECKSD772E_GA0070983_100212 [Candidatus Kentron sp. SD]
MIIKKSVGVGAGNVPKEVVAVRELLGGHFDSWFPCLFRWRDGRADAGMRGGRRPGLHMRAPVSGERNRLLARRVQRETQKRQLICLFPARLRKFIKFYETSVLLYQ